MQTMQTEMMNVTGMKCGGCPSKLSLALLIAALERGVPIRVLLPACPKTPN
jgi:hypothetical protein